MSLDDGLVEDVHGQEKTGRTPIDISLDDWKKLCILQCTEEELAGFFEVSLSTIKRRKKLPEYQAAWDAGRANGKISLRREMWSTARSRTNGSAAAQMQIHLSKHWLGMTEKAAAVDLTLSVEVSSARDRVNRKLDDLSERLKGRVAGIASAAGAQLAPAGAE